MAAANIFGLSLVIFNSVKHFFQPTLARLDKIVLRLLDDLLSGLTHGTLLELCSVSALVILYAIWDLFLFVISSSASADPYIFRVIINSYQCPTQVPTIILIVLSREALTHMYIRLYYGIPG